MPYIEIQDKRMFYEIFGEGEPVVFLNGIMMSTLSWRPFVPLFSNYRMILVDLIDQGKSDKGSCEYSQELHVEMLRELFEKLELNRVNLLGISYGGEVAMRFALKYGSYLSSLILSNTTSRTNHLMKDIEDAWYHAAGTNDGKVFFKVTMPYIYSTRFYEEKIGWLKAREKVLSNSLTTEWYEGFKRAIKSASDLDITEEIPNIKTPTLLIGADLDIITPIRYQEEIHGRIEGSRMVIIKDAGHASMYEKPHEFASIVLGFLSVYDKDIKII